MAEREYKFDAFISYRHCELDKFVAENLHKILETYDLPKNIKKRLNINDKAIKRVFRDQEELPLSSNLEDPIIDALENSKYLIVICSPRLKDSLWCKKEIQTFKKLRGRKNIFCVLIEGEPNDSFPEEVLTDEVEVFKNGKMVKETVPVEPLAADVRGTNNREVLKKIKQEKLRLIAPMFNLDYDDLKQRQKIREQKRIISIAVSVAAFSILFAIYSLAMFIKINTQQNILATHQALSLANESMNYMNSDNRYEAIKTAYEALTEFEDVNMPYTSEAEYALSESLGVYDVGSTFKAVKEYKTNGVASYIKSSSDDKVVAIYDESETITIIDAKTMEVLYTNKTTGKNVSNNIFTFVGNDKLAYINKDNNITIVDINSRKDIKTIDKANDNIIGIKATDEILTYVDTSNLYVYNLKEDRLIGSLSNKDNKYTKDLFISSDNKYVIAFTTPYGVNLNFDINKKYFLSIHVISTSDLKEINSKNLEAEYLDSVVIKEDTAFISLNNMDGSKYDMIVLSYNLVNGTINWSKNYEDSWGKLMVASYISGVNDIAVSSYEILRVMNASTGKLYDLFNLTSEIVGLYPLKNTNAYLAFLKEGKVNYINMETNKIIEYQGEFDLNLTDYSKVIATTSGFMLIPTNENRVILYEKKANPDIQEVDKTDRIKTNSVNQIDYDQIKEEYNITNKSLVKSMFYDTNRELLFVSYTNEDLAIYKTSDKSLVKYLNKVGNVMYYYGKDSNNRMYVSDMYESYIIDSDYNKVGHINDLVKVDNDKVIIANDGKYYSVKIYYLNDLLNMAKDYLKIE